MKKISLFMFVVMLLTVFQAKAFYVDGLEYRDDGEYVTLIGAADKTISHLTIPASVSYNSKTYSVGKVDGLNGGFRNFSKLKTVSISPSENTLLVGYSPFSGCELDRVFVGRSISVTVFDNFIFSGAKIKSIEFGGKLTEVEANICSRHEELELAFISEGIEKINYWAFRECTSLSHISFPTSLTVIDSESFVECKSLKEVNLPEGTLSIGASAFARCISLEKVSFPLNLTAIRQRAFMECSSLKEAVLPNNISVIEDNAFEKCAIETAVIPSSLKELGTNVFKNCASLKAVTIEASDEILKVGYSPFGGCELDNVSFERKLGDLQTFSAEKIFNDTKIKSMAFGEKLTEIPAIVNGHTELEHVLIHEGAKEIRSSAFFGCTSLSNVSLPDGLLVIGGAAFSGCTSLKNVTLNSGLKELVNDTFNGSGLEAIEIPASVEKIGPSFINCKSLKNVIIYESDSALVVNVSSFGNCPFTNCEIDSLYVGRNISSYNFLTGGAKIKSIAIGGKMKEVPTQFCQGHKELERLNVMDGVEIIGISAFEGCGSLRCISLPSSLIRIKNDAFCNCSALEELNLPANLTYIESRVFRGCSSLRNIYFQDGLTTIGWEAFMGCTSLEKLDLPNNLKTIDYSAFKGTTSLKKIQFPASLRELSPNVFSECGIETLEIPASIDSITQSFTDCASLKTVVICDDDSELYAKHPFLNCSLDSLYIGRNFGAEIYTGMTVNALAFGGKISHIKEFRNHDELERLYIPETINKLPPYAFSGNKNIKEIYCAANIPPVCEEYSGNYYTFENDVYDNAILTVKPGTKKLYQKAEIWKLFKNIQIEGGGFKVTAEYDSICGHVTLNGSMQKEILVDEDESLEIAIFPSEGYAIESVTVNGTDVTAQITDNKFYYEAIDSTILVRVDFKPLSFNVTIPENLTGGYLTINGEKAAPAKIVYGSRMEICAVANEGYKLKSFTVNGVNVESPYIIEKVDCNIDVDAEFIQLFTVTYACDSNCGEIRPNQHSGTGAVIVESGSSLELQIVPNEGFEIATVLLDSKDVTDKVDTNGILILKDINANHHVEASFKIKRIYLSVLGLEGGEIAMGYDYGMEATILVKAAENWVFHSLSIGERTITELDNDNTYTTEPLKDNAEICVVFKAIEESSANSIEITPFTVRSCRQTIIVSGADPGTSVQVFDMAGVSVYYGTDHEITLNRQGVFLVCIDGQTFKVMLR